MNIQSNLSNKNNFNSNVMRTLKKITKRDLSFKWSALIDIPLIWVHMCKRIIAAGGYII